MLGFIVRRSLSGLLTLAAVSVVSFAIIILPPGDALTTYISQIMAATGEMTPEMQRQIEHMQDQYGFNDPLYVQYFKWVRGIVVAGDFGWSFATLRNVSDFIWGLMANTLILIFASMAFIYLLAVPIAFYSAVRPYSLIDYMATFLGFLGLAIPNFMLALFLMFAAYSLTGQVSVGMFSAQMETAAWSVARVLDLLRHIWIPVLVIGSAGMASVIRILRSNLLDELNKPYVQMARAKGVPEWRLLIKYPLRIAINPLLSTIGFLLPDLFGATIIVSIVLGLPTVGPVFLSALLNQDMYLAGSIVLLIAAATIIGTLVSDILLALADPRIRYE